ncbi:hypothetical protein JXA56_00760 [Candidatus Micrarchaeota archaeon]|nr:hypothetical protein [Candidatus Micrarchaeota archaeon]
MQFTYPKPVRFRNNNIRKPVMSDKDRDYLLSGKVIVEEKMDGKQTIASCRKYIFCTEDLKKRHSITYAVPARYMIFDIFDLGKGQFFGPEEKHDAVLYYMRKTNELPEVLRSGIFPANIVGRGKLSLEEIEKMIDLRSAYAVEGKMEGVVVKPDRALFYDEFLSGKVIRMEFENGIGTHHMRMPAEYNLINPDFASKNQ